MVLSSRPRIIVGLTLLVGLGSAGRPIAQDPSAPWITTDERLTLLSANDGATHLHVRPLEYDRDPDVVTQDSITVVRLGPDHPPIVNTVYGTAPNSIIGAPYIAMTGDGRYGFVPSMRNPFAPALFGVSEPADLISVIDLGAVEPIVTQTVDVPLINNMLHMHPNGRHLLVPTTNGFQVYEMRGADLALVRDNPTGIATLSFDINAAGDRIIASGRSGSLPSAIDDVDQLGVHLFSYDDGAVEYLHEVDVQEGLPPFRAPFSMRFSPDGTRVLVPNGGGGGSKGSLDDILIVDMTLSQPAATEVIRQVADGIESLAFHPDGHMAVVACLEELPPLTHNSYSDLAVVDLTTSPPRLLYRVDIEAFPEGIEFSPDGAHLFVQATSAHRIAVYDVDGFLLRRSPFFLRVGHGPSSMAIGPSFVR